MVYIADRYARTPIDFLLERKAHQHVRHRLPDAMNPFGSPCPDRRADEMHSGDAGLLELRFQREIEVRRVDADEHARPFVQEITRDARTDPQQFRQMTQYLDIAVDRQFLARVDRLDAGLDHARAGDAGSLQIWAALLQRGNEVRPQEIAGRFTGDHAQIDHRMMPRSARARKSSSCCTSACFTPSDASLACASARVLPSR